ncbi:hypothetical protein ACLB1E_20145 [Escherichia coli]
MVKELAKYPFTAITGVNALFNALLNNKEFQQLDFSSLHLSAGGGMPVQQVVAGVGETDRTVSAGRLWPYRVCAAGQR